MKRVWAGQLAIAFGSPMRDCSYYERILED